MNMPNTVKLFTLVSLSVMSMLSISSAKASENPMDHVGQAHNLYLDCLETSKNQSDSPLQRLVVECGVDAEMPVEDFVKKYQFILEIDPTLSVAKRMQPYRKSYTDREFAYFHKLDTIFQTALSPADVDARLAKLEAEAIAELDPESHAGANILGGLSTARHSLSYWAQAGYAGSSNTTAKGFWRWLAIVGADAVAGLVATEIGLGALSQPLSSAASSAVRDLFDN
jgi:hypothetical protein